MKRDEVCVHAGCRSEAIYKPRWKQGWWPLVLSIDLYFSPSMMIHAHRNGQAEWAMMDGWTPGGCRGSLHPSILLSLILVIASMDDDCFDFKAGDMGPSMGQAAAPCMASSCC